MPTTAAITRGESSAVPLESASIWLLYAALLWPALAGGAHAGWLLAATQLLVLLSALAWVLGMVAAGRLEWRRTALDRPVGLIVVLIATQLALGPGPLLRWALASPESAASLPARFLFVGTVSPGDTTRALLLFLTYVGVYVVVVNVVRRRADVERLVRTLLVTGGVVAFASLVDFLAREDWIFRWREERLNARLTGPFANPDHCATWLLMLVCLGVGYLAARRGQARSESGRLADIVRSPRDREAALRRYLPAFGVGLMTLAMVLTLSRGALVSLAVTGVLGLLAAARLGGLRWSLASACALGAVILGYGLWIGLGPLLHRVGSADALGRVLQWQATLPMLAAFPTFGVGLGAYKEAFFHFQPSTLGAGHMYFPYAHSDLLQLLIETGPLGAALSLWAAGRVARDLVGAHLLGRGRCPVGRDTDGRRSDPFSVGIAMGALGAVVALLVHSAVDFPARIPADGILAAACLGLATTAMHTRFTGGGPLVMEVVGQRRLGAGLAQRVVASAVALGLAAGLVPWIIGPARVEAAPAERAQSGLAEARRLLAARAPGEQAPPEAQALTRAAVADLRRLIASTPSNPFVHERLAWALELQSAARGEGGAELHRAALVSMQRAVALQPENPYLYRSQAALNLTGEASGLGVALAAGRRAVELDPALLPDLVDRLAPRGLEAGQWGDLVPSRPATLTALAAQLESRGFLREADALYERALQHAETDEAAAIRWAWAQLLLGIRQPARALAQMDAALARSPGHPELLLIRARALTALGRPEALASFSEALQSAQARQRAGERLVFADEAPALRAIVSSRLGGDSRLSTARYRRALAQRLSDEGQWPAARAEWDRALAEGPLDAAGHFAHAQALEATGERTRALEAYGQAVALDARAVTYRVRLAERLWEAEQYVQGLAEWQRLVEQEPRNVQMRVALARAYLKTGDRDRALGEYRRVLSLEPGHGEARQLVARLAQP
jgi:tetratricopeptide (TPR) repeat protein